MKLRAASDFKPRVQQRAGCWASTAGLLAWVGAWRRGVALALAAGLDSATYCPLHQLLLSAPSHASRLWQSGLGCLTRPTLLHYRLTFGIG